MKHTALLIGDIAYATVSVGVGIGEGRRDGVAVGVMAAIAWPMPALAILGVRISDWMKPWPETSIR